MNLSETLTKIKNYTRENLELQKCHHFLFNLPLDKTSIKADVLVIGLNPGEGPFDWDYVNTPNTPTEETHEFDFHMNLGRVVRRYDGVNYAKNTYLILKFFKVNFSFGALLIPKMNLLIVLDTLLKIVLTLISVRNVT